MKKSIFKFILAPLCLVLLSTQCDEDNELTQEQELEELNILKTEIETLASTSICNENTECKFIGLGSKPCGGVWSYLIYSTSIDIDELESLVQTYNERQDNFNRKWGVISDCSLANPPTSISCENNTCVAVF